MTTSKPLPEGTDELPSSQGESAVQPTDVLATSKKEQVATQLSQSPTEQYGTWGRIEMIDGKKYFVRPSVRLRNDGYAEEFVQQVPILSLEVNEETVELLGLPLEAMAMTPAQQREFEEQGGLMNPQPDIAIAEENQDKMMYWAESFEALQSVIDGTLYKGFDLFKKVYEAFPDIAAMTQEEATAQGLYPTIHYRNFAARKYMAEMNGGHIAPQDKDYKGELGDIYNVAEGKTNLEKLAAMGQAPLGCRDDLCGDVYVLGSWAGLGSGSLNGDGDVRVLSAHRDKAGAGIEWYGQGTAASSVVVVNP